jgi:hypothetical protein
MSAGTLLVHQVKYLGVVFDRKISWTLYIDMIEAKAFRTLESTSSPKVSD